MLDSAAAAPLSAAGRAPAVSCGGERTKAPAQATADVAAMHSWGETFRQKFICEEAERLSLEGALQFYAALGASSNSGSDSLPTHG